MATDKTRGPSLFWVGLPCLSLQKGDEISLNVNAFCGLCNYVLHRVLESRLNFDLYSKDWIPAAQKGAASPLHFRAVNGFLVFCVIGSYLIQRKKDWKEDSDVRQLQDQTSPLRWSKLFVSLVLMGKGEGRGSAVLSESVAQENGSFKAGQSLWTPHTHTHLLSRRFRNCRLRSDHPQEGKQSLISTLQGPALSPGLSPLHTTHYTLRTTHRFPDRLTSPALSFEILSEILLINL